MGEFLGMTTIEREPRQLELFSIVDPKLTAQAMRDNGYKSTTYAIAEIIDNAIESGAETIQLFGLSKVEFVKQRKRNRLKELAVLDNGCGMDKDTLRGALRYGYGTRQARNGIGRYGMGLPNSTMSQCRCLDVWSWQSRPSNALHTHLYLDDVENGLREIPEPILKSLPSRYRQASQTELGESGTLVLWRELDRTQWTSVEKTFEQTEYLLGRIYRRFVAKRSERIHENDTRNEELGLQRTISLIPMIQINEKIEVQRDNIVNVRPNDPLYLMAGTSCPEEFGEGRMFEELNEPLNIPISYENKKYNVRLRASYARALARDPWHSGATWPEDLKERDAGFTPWGKHAANNTGVSLIRAHREIQLDTSWVADDTRERWWSIEVDFPTALDELFGVTNNKQGAMTFQRLSGYDWTREAIEGEKSPRDVRERLELEGDPRMSLLPIYNQIKNYLSVIRPRVKSVKQSRGKDKHVNREELESSEKATAAIKKRQKEGYEGESDRAAVIGTVKEHENAQLDSLTNKHHLSLEEAHQKVTETMTNGSKVAWIQSNQQSPAFFDVDPQPGVVYVALNTNHAVHQHLWEVMHPQKIDEMDNDELLKQLEKTAMAFRILIYSWARFEEEQLNKIRKNVINARIEWGKYAEDFFDIEDDDPGPTNLI